MVDPHGNAPMPRSKTKPSVLSPAGFAFLAAQLEAIARPSAHAHHRRVQRLAVTVRYCRRHRDELPENAIPYDAFRLFALSHRWVEHRGRVTPNVVLAIYRPTID